jgi:hypothetical protein
VEEQARRSTHATQRNVTERKAEARHWHLRGCILADHQRFGLILALALALALAFVASLHGGQEACRPRRFIRRGKV